MTELKERAFNGTVTHVNVTDQKQRENVGFSGVIGQDMKTISSLNMIDWYTTLADTGQ